MEGKQPVKVVIKRAIGSSLVIAEDFFGDGFTFVFMLLSGIVVFGGGAPDPPHEQWDERAENGEDGDSHRSEWDA